MPQMQTHRAIHGARGMLLRCLPIQGHALRIELGLTRDGA